MKKIILSFFLILSPFLDATLFRRIEEMDLNVPVFACRTIGYDSNDTQLIQRIVTSYQLAKKENLGNSMWQMFFDRRHKDIHNTFIAGQFDRCAHILRHPKDSDLFYGFDNLCVTFLPTHTKPSSLVDFGVSSLDLLVRFGEAIAAIKLDNPEMYGGHAKRKWNASTVLSTIESKLGKEVLFPNPYIDEIGIWTPHGVASTRAIWAFYQAYLIKEHLKGIDNPKVLEIGAGLGRTAYFARMFDIKDYTIIDIPISNLSQAYFLGKVLGDDQVSLLGEAGEKNKIKILTPDQFLNDKDQYYDLIINVDSLTEMASETMQAYINKISQSTSLFISVNHEWNAHTVNDFAMKSQNLKSHERKPYWMRLGHIEEIYKFNP
jgi:hypothetical protein